MKNVYIFLDFDGVLHSEKETLRYGEAFEFIYNFELKKLINKLSNDYLINIIFTTTWRNNHSLNQLISFIDKDINDENVFIAYDKTESIKSDLWSESKGFYQEENRYLEIKKYITVNNIKSNEYVVIDDRGDIFFNIKLNDKKLPVKEYFLTDENQNILPEPSDLFEKELYNAFIHTNKPKRNDAYINSIDIDKALNYLQYGETQKNEEVYISRHRRSN